MKMKQVFIFGLICVLAVALFAGCSSQNGGGGGEAEDQGAVETGHALSAKEILAASAEAMSAYGNYRALMRVEMEMSALDEDMTMDIDTEMDVFTDPLKVKMKMTMDMPELSSIVMDTYVFQEGDDLVTYMDLSAAFGTPGAWYKTVEPVSAESLSQYNLNMYSNTFLESYVQAEIASEELVGGMECYKLDVVIDASGMMKLLDTTDFGQQFGEEITPDMIAAMENLTATIWISKDGFYQVKVEMDMADILNPIMSQFEGDIDVSRMWLSLMTSDIGKTPDFTLPEEAKNAEFLPS